MKNPRLSGKDHYDVEYFVNGTWSNDSPTWSFKEAAAMALAIAASRGEAILDVVISSEAGAKHYGGDDAVAQYLEDPEASIFERFEIKVNNCGRIA